MGTHVDVEEKTTYDWPYQYGSSHPHAPTKIGRRIYTYDLNGNQLGWTYPPEPDHSAGSATDTATQGTGHVSGPGRHLLWDEENRLQEYETEETETYYTYNDKGERVYKKTEDEDHTFYLNQYYIVRNDAIVSKHLFAGATRIVTRLVEPPEEDSEDAHVDKLYFYHPDHLGSTGYTTNRKGRVNEHHEYFPFGETWIEQEGDSKRPMYLYTGKELDQESGLYYYGARYYDPRTSVWQSADPILAKYLPSGDVKRDAKLPGLGGVFNPVNLAMYGYAGLNPVKYVDPDGNELDFNSYSFANNKVSSNLVALNKAVMKVTGKRDSEFGIRVTGADRYRDIHGIARSMTTGKVVPEAAKNSPHLIENGARGADISVTGISKDDLKKAVALTDFSLTKGNYLDSYDDGHVHVGLSKDPKNNVSGFGKLIAETQKFFRNTVQAITEPTKKARK